MVINPHHLAILCFKILVFLLPCQSMAEHIVMRNGDLISGQVKKIEDGELFIEPVYADEFAVDMAAVESIKSDNFYEIELADGREIYGRFVGGSEGRQRLTGDDGEYDVRMSDLLDAAEPEPWYDRDSHIDINMVWNGGNTDSRNNLLYFDTTLKTGEHRQLIELTFRRDETDGVSTKEQDLLRYGYNWIFSRPWYLGVTAGFERDPVRGLDHRHILGALFGRDIIDDRHRYFTISAGAGYSKDKIGDDRESGSSALWHLRYEHDLRDSDIEFFHRQTLILQTYGEHNTILKTNTGLRFDLLEDIYANISVRYDYESDPAPGAENDDSTLVFGVGAKF